MIGIMLLALGVAIILFALLNISVGEQTKLETILIIVGICLIVGMLTQPVIREDKTYNLVALANKSSIEGSFFICSGIVRDISINTFAYKEGEVIRIKNVEMSERDEYIYTDNPPKAIVHWRYKRLFGDVAKYYCTFYIPPGSVKQQYDIDITK